MTRAVGVGHDDEPEMIVESEIEHRAVHVEQEGLDVSPINGYMWFTHG